MPADANYTTTEKLKDDTGKEVAEGKMYKLKGYNKAGKPKTVEFSVQGKHDQYYRPGTYLKIGMSKTIVLSQKVVNEDDIPEAALTKLNSK